MGIFGLFRMRATKSEINHFFNLTPFSNYNIIYTLRVSKEDQEISRKINIDKMIDGYKYPTAYIYDKNEHLMRSSLIGRTRYKSVL